MNKLSPFTYLVEGMMGNILASSPIRCDPQEFSLIQPPAGQSCDQYLGGFSTNLTNPNPTGAGYYEQLQDGSCAYCQYREGEDFLA